MSAASVEVLAPLCEKRVVTKTCLAWAMTHDFAAGIVFWQAQLQYGILPHFSGRSRVEAGRAKLAPDLIAMHEVGKLSNAKTTYATARDAFAYFESHPAPRGLIEGEKWPPPEPLPGYNGTEHYRKHGRMSGEKFDVYPPSECERDATGPPVHGPGAPKPKPPPKPHGALAEARLEPPSQPLHGPSLGRLRAEAMAEARAEVSGRGAAAEARAAEPAAVEPAGELASPGEN